MFWSFTRSEAQIILHKARCVLQQLIEDQCQGLQETLTVSIQPKMLYGLFVV